MAIDLENLPEDADALRELVTNAELENVGLRAEIDKLHMLIKGFQRHRFGKRSEQLDAEQMQLVIEDLEQTMGAGAAAGEARAESEAQAGQSSGTRPARRQRNLGQLPDSLPRFEVVIDLEDKTCPCCRGELQRVGESRAEIYAEDRKGARPATHLANFRGIVQVDGYTGFGQVVKERADASVKLAFCWVHARRGFFEVHASTKSPIAAEALARIAALYAIEAEIRGKPAAQRQAVRQERSRPIVEALHAWLNQQLPRISKATKLAEAIRYTLRHWEGLTRFLDDGRLELDTNTVEREIRPITLGRKNALFAGNDAGAEHWAIAATLIASAKLNGVNPLAYLTDVLERIVAGRTKITEIEALLPWNWRPAGMAELPAAA